MTNEKIKELERELKELQEERETEAKIKELKKKIKEEKFLQSRTGKTFSGISKFVVGKPTSKKKKKVKSVGEVMEDMDKTMEGLLQ